MITLNAWTSLTVLCKEAIESFVAMELSETLELTDFEAAVSMQELPPVDLLGLVTFSADEVSTNIWRAQFAIGVSTFDDASLFRHRQIMARVVEMVKSGTSIPIYDPETSQVYSWAKVVDGTSLAPIANTQVRGFQFVSAEMLIDPMAG